MSKPPTLESARLAFSRGEIQSTGRAAATHYRQAASQAITIADSLSAQLADERKYGDRLVEALKIAHDRTECEHDRINIGDEDPCPVCDLLAAHTERTEP